MPAISCRTCGGSHFTVRCPNSVSAEATKTSDSQAGASKKESYEEQIQCVLSKVDYFDVPFDPSRVFSPRDIAYYHKTVKTLRDELAKFYDLHPRPIPIDGRARRLLVDGKWNGPFGKGSNTNFDFSLGLVDFSKDGFRFQNQCPSKSSKPGSRMFKHSMASLWSQKTMHERRREHVVNCIKDGKRLCGFVGSSTIGRQRCGSEGGQCKNDTEIAELLMAEFFPGNASFGEEDEGEQQEDDANKGQDNAKISRGTDYEGASQKSIDHDTADSHPDEKNAKIPAEISNPQNELAECRRNFYVRVSIPGHARSVKVFRDPGTTSRGFVCTGCENLSRAVRTKRIYCEAYTRMFELLGAPGTEHNFFVETLREEPARRTN